MIGAVRKTHHKRQATTQPISLLLEGFLTPIAEGNGIKSGLETPPTRGSFLKLTLMAEYAYGILHWLGNRKSTV